MVLAKRKVTRSNLYQPIDRSRRGDLDKAFRDIETWDKERHNIPQPKASSVTATITGPIYSAPVSPDEIGKYRDIGHRISDDGLHDITDCGRCDPDFSLPAFDDTPRPAVYPQGWHEQARGNTQSGLTRWREWLERQR